MSDNLAEVDKLYEEGLEMKRSQLRRENRSLSDSELDELLRDWLNDRPFDAPGHIRHL